MIENKYETKEHVVTERVLVSRHLFCDICRKEVTKGQGYFYGHTQHSEWGNDSCESYESFHICSSIECLKAKIEEYAKESQDHNSLEIEIQHDTWE